jgi:hypothetical protein
VGTPKTNLKQVPIAVEWRVQRIGGAKGRMLGTVIAPDAATALELAMAELNIPPAERRRIVVVQTEVEGIRLSRLATSGGPW